MAGTPLTPPASRLVTLLCAPPPPPGMEAEMEEEGGMFGGWSVQCPSQGFLLPVWAARPLGIPVPQTR